MDVAAAQDSLSSDGSMAQLFASDSDVMRAQERKTNPRERERRRTKRKRTKERKTRKKGRNEFH
jgi:hypothetical protein